MSPILLGFAHLGLQDRQAAFAAFHSIAERLDGERLLMDWIWRMPLHYGLSTYWLEQGDYRQARQEAERVLQVATPPGERTYLALSQGMLTEIALAQHKWEDAEAALSQALAVLEGAEAPLAEWRVCALAARLHTQRRRTAEAARYWTRGATVLQRLADSLGAAEDLRHSLLTIPAVQTILHHARTPAKGRESRKSEKM